ncbi:bifunctional ADP-dependent NAD(P)H-hydrate dehydratase/NAD(P)H-hydrate epimerase [Fervidobacterium thailandense]|uniref:Bifunctional NAD(P)H-hydrate repair enzyme n=1 Tax=Fervidobacterium thailandense TaxID=1008305 RepID=A0A1E3G4G5_9BACT|nr:bifunctional ADP-dependent NAD(P)H-hydrate dehydratase/NAD(P)H-hydrate epimerase [Fervidobacterium thailandense]ODN31129.1 bifunctional ADP-dependent (S)-NAD(P)H-hydrate dehydratase/NAD(P)H-hydrate epimerase [Fervidobacterium thailandense]
MRIVTASEMRELEFTTCRDFLIDEEILMERAGISVVEAMWNELGDLKSKNFIIFCGPGNNGGDGYVVARDLLNTTEAVKVVVLDEPKTAAARKNFERYVKQGGVVLKIDELDPKVVSDMISSADVVIDAIFGTGLNKPVTDEKYSSVIEMINFYSRYIVSVDIPSGVEADTGRILEHAVRADLTVTFGFPKPGHFLYPGRELTGKLKVANIGIPLQASTLLYSGMYLLTRDTIERPQRPKWAYKGYFKKVYVIGGSERYKGAPILTALAAQRSGAGYVKLVSTREVCNLAVSLDPSLVCVDVRHSLEVKNVLRELGENAVCVLGPGWDLDRAEEKLNFIESLLKEFKGTLILDADGLNILAKKVEILKAADRKARVILTPHPGEFSRLTGKPLNEVRQNYAEVKKFSSEFNVLTILKDATSIISDGNSVFFNITGNSSLSKAGSGDILAGIIAGFVSQHMEPLEAVKAAAYFFGLIGESVENEGMNSSFELLSRMGKIIKW